jgi:hypothetical protein
MKDTAGTRKILSPGAARGIRTPDPIITNDVLYQLSYCGFTKDAKSLVENCLSIQAPLCPHIRNSDRGFGMTQTGAVGDIA